MTQAGDDEFIGLLAMKTAKGKRIASINRTLYFDSDSPPTQNGDHIIRREEIRQAHV